MPRCITERGEEGSNKSLTGGAFVRGSIVARENEKVRMREAAEAGARQEEGELGGSAWVLSIVGDFQRSGVGDPKEARRPGTVHCSSTAVFPSVGTESKDVLGCF